MSDETEVDGSIETAAKRMSAYWAGQEDANDTPQPTEVEAAPEAAPESEVSAEASDDQQQPDQPAETAESDSLVDIEYEGKAYKLPTEIRDAIMRHRDYTVKTMDLSEHRKQFQKERELIDLQRSFESEVGEEQKQIARLEAQIDQYKRLDWGTMEMGELTKYKFALDQLKDEKRDLEQSVGAKKDKFLKQTEDAKKELLRNGAQYLAKKIPKWGQEAYQEFAQGAMDAGFTQDEVSNFMDPRAIHLAWKARQWDKLQTTVKPRVQEKVKDVPPVVKPGSRDTTASTESKNVKAIRDQFKKSGDTRDLAQLLLAKKMV